MEKETRGPEIRQMKSDWFMAPNSVFDTDILKNINTRCIYLYLCRWANTQSRAWPTYETIAKDNYCSRKTVSRALKEIKEAGLLLVEKRENKSNLYTVLAPPTTPKISTSEDAKSTLKKLVEQLGAEEILELFYEIINRRTPESNIPHSREQHTQQEGANMLNILVALVVYDVNTPESTEVR